MEFQKPKKIFIADDDILISESLKDYLTKTIPHEVQSFNTGEELLKHLSESPDVVILDYHLNSSQKDAANGMEILNAIKKNYSETHVIMLSSQERYGVAMQTLQNGAEHYVIKDEHAFEKISKMVNQMK
jgi:two-component system OmpR family response regulator